MVSSRLRKRNGDIDARSGSHRPRDRSPPPHGRLNTAGTLMLSRSNDQFLIDDLQSLDRSNNGWFSDDTIVARTGRCLLDTLEYLRSDSKLPGRFRQVTDA